MFHMMKILGLQLLERHLTVYRVSQTFWCRFTKDHVVHLDSNKQWSRALDGSEYMPGMVSHPSLILRSLSEAA